MTNATNEFNIESFRFPWTLKETKQQKAKWVIYTRVSSKRQVNEWNWLESQRNKCIRRAKENGNIEILKHFSDDWISWASNDREWINKAWDYIIASKWEITHFICTETSRVSRSTEIWDSISLISWLQHVWCNFVITDQWGSQPLMGTAEWMVQVTFKFIAATLEKINIQNRTQWWIENRIRQWYWASSWIPCGYKKEKTYTTDEQKNKRKRNMILIKDDPSFSTLKEWLEMFA